ncbi:MAG TPA: MG2 domain-containing protein, partial [Thermoanaerobaculia bacterium]
LRFNQAVDPATISSHLQLRTVAHPFETPAAPSDPLFAPAFRQKVERAAAASASSGQPILAFVTKEWDEKRIEPGTDLVVLETKPGIQPDTWIQVFIDDSVAASARDARPGRTQEFTIQLGPTFFVNRMSCSSDCDPEWGTNIEFRTGVLARNVRAATTVTDITDPAKPVVLEPVARDTGFDYPSTSHSLDLIGFDLQPARRYQIRVDPSLKAEDGQTLGYTFTAVVDVLHKAAFISFGDGEGVWESSGGAILPFSARNFRSVTQWLAPLQIEGVMPLLRQMRLSGFRQIPPDSKGQPRTLRVIPDKIQSFGLDVGSTIGSDGRGLLWAAMSPGQAIPRSHVYDPSARATIVQVTNLGLSVKDSPLNTLVLVTRLDNGAPVAGANVSIRTTDNKVFWSGTTNAEGVAVAPNTALRVPPRTTPEAEDADERANAFDYPEESWRALGDLHFIVVAEKDGDVAYVASDWNEGISPWEFGTNFEINEANPMLRGTFFSDRGVYKLGEEVHAKLIIRSDTPTGMTLLPAGTRVDVSLRDAHNREIAKDTLALNEWSSAEWVFRVPADAPLGNYSMRARVAGQRLTIFGSFLVAAYRRPDFRVDVTLDAPSSVAGTPLTGRVTGRYLHGAAMAGADVRWTYTKRGLFDVPSTITDRWPSDRYVFLGSSDGVTGERITISSDEDALSPTGELTLSLPTEKDAGWPYEYRLEAAVTDVTRQEIANRGTFRVDPASFYIGVQRPPYFAEATDGIRTEIVAVGHDGLAVPGVNVEVTLERIQYNSIRRAVGNGFYEWDTEEKHVPAGSWTVTTESTPAPLAVKLSEGGQYRLTARAKDSEGRSTVTRTWFYVVGPGYTAWARYD